MGDLSEINRLAARQHGAFNRAQARSAGFDRSATSRRIASGQWVSLDDSVYGVASAPHTWEQTLAVAVLSRESALLTHVTACRLLGLSGFRKEPPVLLLPRGSNTRSDLARVFESDQCGQIARTVVEGLPITTMPETLLVLARDTPAWRVTEVFDEALVAGLLDLRAMASTIDREAGRRTPGTPLLRHLTSSRRPGAPSKSSTYLERLMEMILHDPRIPPWTREYRFSLDGVPARVDVFVPSVRLVIEADGRNWHTKSQDFETDRRRDNGLAALGIQVLRYTYQMLTNEPVRCLEETLATCLIRAA